METKICSYTEKNVRLQLLLIDDNRFELRINRRYVNDWHKSYAIDARLSFAAAVQIIVMTRSIDLSFLTSRISCARPYYLI